MYTGTKYRLWYRTPFKQNSIAHREIESICEDIAFINF